MSDGKIKAVEVEAELRQVKSMADGSVNITFNLPEYCIDQAKILLGWLKDEVRLIIEDKK